MACLQKSLQFCSCLCKRRVDRHPDSKGLTALEAASVQEMILSFPDALQLDSLRLFAKEFIKNAA